MAISTRRESIHGGSGAASLPHTVEMAMNSLSPWHPNTKLTQRDPFTYLWSF